MGRCEETPAQLPSFVMEEVIVNLLPSQEGNEGSQSLKGWVFSKTPLICLLRRP